MNDKENQGLTFHISPNQTFLCDINIDSISKDKSYLLIKTGNTIKRLKISDIRQAIRLVMETNKHDTKDITSTMEVAEKDMKNKALKAFCRSCIRYRPSDGLCLDGFCEDCPMPVTYCTQCIDAKMADDYMCYRKKKFMEQLNEIK